MRAGLDIRKPDFSQRALELSHRCVASSWPVTSSVSSSDFHFKAFHHWPVVKFSFNSNFLISTLLPLPPPRISLYPLKSANTSQEFLSP